MSYNDINHFFCMTILQLREMIAKCNCWAICADQKKKKNKKAICFFIVFFKKLKKKTNAFQKLIKSTVKIMKKQFLNLF